MVMPRILDYAPPSRISSGISLRLALAGIAFVISFLNMNLTGCMCGYQDWISVPGNLVGFALAIGAFCLASRAFITRVLSAFVLIVCTLIFFLNVHNILWSGHNPIFH
jgi:hypothetical protein